MAAVKEEWVRFTSVDLRLEGVLSTPDPGRVLPAAVVCHPHPLYGGSMDNGVVLSLCEALVENGFVTLRFNFRGVGRSGGRYDRGVGEKEDIKAAISFLTASSSVDSDRVALVGYSAGASFGLPVGAGDARIKGLVGVSPPVNGPDLEAVKVCPKPKLFVAGSEDDVATASAIKEFCRRCVDPKECVIVDGADHFWSGHEHELTRPVTAFLAKVVRPRAQPEL
jgi:alpha/beta superfamily hydrolase